MGEKGEAAPRKASSESRQVQRAGTSRQHTHRFHRHPAASRTAKWRGLRALDFDG